MVINSMQLEHYAMMQDSLEPCAAFVAYTIGTYLFDLYSDRKLLVVIARISCSVIEMPKAVFVLLLH